jgi:hypothetical protein
VDAILAADAVRHRETAVLMFTILTSFLGKPFGHPGARINIET